MEMLIAMTLLIVLGGGLVTILRQSVSIWSTAESRGRRYEQARALLELITSDLRSTAIRSHQDDADSWLRFIADRYRHLEGAEVQRLRFVRTISGEMADPVLREGGRRLATTSPRYHDGTPLRDAAEAERLLAPAGLMEVFYLQDPRPGANRVWRGIRAPIGGAHSLFIDRNVEPAAVVGLSARTPGDSSAEEDETFFLETFATPIAEHVLYLGFRFWTSTTNTWSDVPALSEAGGQPSGPSSLWDSTRALLSESADRRVAGAFRWRPRKGSLHDARDDVFPEMVEVTVVIANDEEEVLGPRLIERLGTGATSMAVSKELPLDAGAAEPMVLIEGEWIAIESWSECRLTIAENGRGRRGTGVASHDVGARVLTGLSFSRVIAVPSFRRDPVNSAEARTSLRRLRR